jgi:hypothetical protein
MNTDPARCSRVPCGLIPAVGAGAAGGRGEEQRAWPASTAAQEQVWTGSRSARTHARSHTNSRASVSEASTEQHTAPLVSRSVRLRVLQPQSQHDPKSARLAERQRCTAPTQRRGLCLAGINCPLAALPNALALAGLCRCLPLHAGLECGLWVWPTSVPCVTSWNLAATAAGAAAHRRPAHVGMHADM